MDINEIFQDVVEATFSANAASVAANPLTHPPAPTPSQPASYHQLSPPDNFFLKSWYGNRD